MSRNRSEELLAPCDGCGRPDGIRHPHRQEHLCPRCGSMYDSGDLAELHLRKLLEPTIATWRAHWVARGAEPVYLDELLKKFDDRSTALLQYRKT